MAKKWSRPKVIVVGVVGLVVAMVVAAAAATLMSPPKVTTVFYEVDVFSGRANPSWGLVAEGGVPVLDLFTVESTAGVAATIPGELGFRGVILTGPDLPGGDALDAIRVVQNGYYLEFADGTVRFVEDASVWPPIRTELEANLEPEVWKAVAGIGGF